MYSGLVDAKIRVLATILGYYLLLYQVHPILYFISYCTILAMLVYQVANAPAVQVHTVVSVCRK
ncbi:hypothetical protein BD777DRAFT_122750 [Yarrowia lipolytica]|nr:hypothetical protein BD777DRAFT_122750 [Yarrowia lipolytica]